MGELSTPPYLDSAALLSQFADTTTTAQRRYRAFVVEGLQGPSPWSEVKGQVLLGNEAFVRKVGSKLDSARLVTEIPKARRHARPSLAQALKKLPPGDVRARDRLIAKLHVRHGYSQAEIGRATGLHYSTVSRIIAGKVHARNKT